MHTCYRRTSITAEQIPREHLACDIGKIVVPTVRNDNGDTLLELIKVMGHVAAEELGSVKRGFIHYNGNTLGPDDLRH